jgi:hypothetical protein
VSAGDGARADAGAGGVLGNLPRSRLGHRSDKRTEPGTSSAAAPRARPSGPTTSRAGADDGDPRRASARPVTPAPAPSSEGGGPLGGAARVAGRAARAGLGVAGGVLKRLPRP